MHFASAILKFYCITLKGRTQCRELPLCAGSGKGVSGKPYPRLCNARRPRLKPGTFRSQAVRLYRLHQVMSTGPIFREVAGKFDFVEISTLAIRLQIRRDSNPATITPLLRWLSTKHNLIDLAKKAFPTSESKSTSKKGKTRNLILQI